MNSVSAIKPVMDPLTANPGNNYLNGIITVGYIKDPRDPRWRNDAAMKLYRDIIGKYAGGTDADDPQVMYGVAKAETFVQTLYKVGKNLTRQRLMNALTNMNSTNKFLLPGIVQKTGKGDRFIISQMQRQRWANGRWQAFGPIVEGRPSRGK